jgi:hypothetical protein
LKEFHGLFFLLIAAPLKVIYLCGTTEGAAMILRSLGCHRRGGCSELLRPFLEIPTDKHHLLQEDHLQDFVLCPLVSTLQFFLLHTKSASNFLGGAYDSRDVMK